MPQPPAIAETLADKLEAQFGLSPANHEDLVKMIQDHLNSFDIETGSFDE